MKGTKLKITEIVEKLQKLKSDIECAFEKELIDFDAIERELAAIIEALATNEKAALSKGKQYLKTENYI